MGCKNQPIEWISWLLAQKDRTLAAPTAKQQGLYLVDVHYLIILHCLKIN